MSGEFVAAMEDVLALYAMPYRRFQNPTRDARLASWTIVQHRRWRHRVSKDNVTYSIYTGRPEHRRAVVARYGHFRVDRLWVRAKRPYESGDWVRYGVVFEVDTEGEFDLGGTQGGPSSPSDLRRSAMDLAWLFRRAHSPPPADRPTSIPYYRRRVWALDLDVEGTPPEEWYEDSFFRRPDRPTIDVDEAAALIEGALHELEEPSPA
jgi:hypothetical protein